MMHIKIVHIIIVNTYIIYVYKIYTKCMYVCMYGYIPPFLGPVIAILVIAIKKLQKFLIH